MPKVKKPIPLEEIYPLLSTLSTTDQKAAIAFLEKILHEKAQAAKEELSIINGKQ
jgi:hypothetical protein